MSYLFRLADFDGFGCARKQVVRFSYVMSVKKPAGAGFGCYDWEVLENLLMQGVPGL